MPAAAAGAQLQRRRAGAPPRRRARGAAGSSRPWLLLSSHALLILACIGAATAFRGLRVSSSPAAAAARARRRGAGGLLRMMSTAAAPESWPSSASASTVTTAMEEEEEEQQQQHRQHQPTAAAAAQASPLQGTLLEPPQLPQPEVEGGGGGAASPYYHYVLPPLVAAQTKAWRVKGKGRAGQRQQEQAEAAVAEGLAVGVISHHEALELLCLREGVGGRGGRQGFYYHEGVSLDLGRSETMVVASEEGISLPAIRDRSRRGRPALVATWGELEEIVAQAQAPAGQGQLGCYALYADGTRPWRISVVSLKTGRAANLLPSRYVKGPPTVVLGSFLMHRLDGPRPGTYIGPAEDTRRKLDAIKMKKVYGRVLDTTTGLGYTAIAAARCAHVAEVVTIEADQAALEMCRYNPWSSDLFASPPSPSSASASSGSGGSSSGNQQQPHRGHGHGAGSGQRSPITVLQGDVCELVKGFGDGSFAAVMHDPPAMALGGKASSALYSAAFYSELYRVLRWRGRLFHFVGGNPKGKEASRMYKTVVQRLEACGFKKVMILASAQGVVAEKGEDRRSKKALHSNHGQGQGRGHGSDRRRRGHGHGHGHGGFSSWDSPFLEDGGWDGYGAAFGFL